MKRDSTRGWALNGLDNSEIIKSDWYENVIKDLAGVLVVCGFRNFCFCSTGRALVQHQPLSRAALNGSVLSPTLEATTPRTYRAAWRTSKAGADAPEAACGARRTGAPRPRRQGAGRLERTDDRRLSRYAGVAFGEPAWLAQGGARLLARSTGPHGAGRPPRAFVAQWPMVVFPGLASDPMWP